MDELLNLRSKVLDQLDLLHSEMTALRCLSGLFASANPKAGVNLEELCYLIDPIIEREAAIYAELLGLFAQGGAHVD